MLEPTLLSSVFLCPACRARLFIRKVGAECAACRQEYPVVGGVLILLPESRTFMRSELLSLQQSCQMAQERVEALRSIKAEVELPAAALERLRAVRTAELVRAHTFLDLMDSVATALEETRDLARPSAVLSGIQYAGWPIDALIPFVLRDWAGTDEFHEATGLVTGALYDTCSDLKELKIAFAGCGAAGLTAAVSRHVDRVIGFDLSLPLLTAARRLLDGDVINLPSLRGVTNFRLVRPQDMASASNVFLCAMDAAVTAFADGALDCVVTSFLLDILGNPYLLAEEVRRILAEGGVWINYGPSGPPNALFRFDDTEMAKLAEVAGFEHISSQRHRTTFLDFTRYDPSSTYESHVCYLTIFRKAAERGLQPTLDRQLPLDLAKVVPYHHSGATLLQPTFPIDPAGGPMILEYSDIRGQQQRFRIPREAAQLLSLVDGHMTVEEVVRGFNHQRPAFDRADTIQAFRRYFELGLLRWHSPPKSKEFRCN